MTPRETPAGVLTADGRVLTAADGPGPLPVARLEQLFEQLCDRVAAEGDRLAVDAGDVRLTFGDLDLRANRLARHLRARDVRSGDRIGLLCAGPVDSYVAMLAVLKAGAAYVPLDAAFPDDRLAFIIRDAGARLVLTAAPLRDRFDEGTDLLCLDEEAGPIAARPGARLPAPEPDADDLCYVVYTSGSTGRPKGVPIHHAAIAGFVRVAAGVYGLAPGDRVYQGMTIAFDFSVEEIWVPLLSGATLVPRPAGGAPAGAELQEFLRDNGVTALCCVPTLLATLEDDLPDLRFLLVSGEACPEDLVGRWSRPGRRFLNVYGPTETTVTATWTVLHPDRPVTIGVPLPTYSVVILDPVASRALPAGELGEIGIAGIGLARGYLNRPDLTERAFIPDFLGIEDNPSGRIYRTGDLGRITADGEIEYHGRADTQVKVRGYRVELTEIESILLRAPGVAQAVVGTYSPEPGTTELVAYYSLRRDAPAVDVEELRRLLRDRLPAYMVPAYFERLDRIPMTPSHKADRARLPAPSGPRALAAETAYTPPETGTERLLAGALAQVCRLERVSVTAHFFADLAADSLLLAKFCARVRESGELAPIPVKQLYQHPTVRELARSVAGAAPAPPPATELPPRAGSLAHALCGVYQVLVFLAYAVGSAVLLDAGYEWISAAAGLLDGYLRAVAASAAGFASLCVLPIALKWLLAGRWRPGEIRLWSAAYLRFWTVKTVTRFCPLAMFAGSPLYVLYLRLLGAKIGDGAVILLRRPPVCTDLLTIGAGAVVRKDALLSCYRAEAGRIRTGRVTVGDRAFVGETAVLDIDTELGADAQLGHSSSLAAGQAVPAGESWHGSPGRPSTVDYRALPAGLAGRARRTVFAVAQLASFLLVLTPAAIGASAAVAWYVQPAEPDPAGWAFFRAELVHSTVLYAGALLGGLAVVLIVPRLLTPFLQPDRVYPLYGLRHSLQRAVARLTNLRTFTYLFGDSSYIVHYLRALGYDLSELRQTGSNFGVEVKHESPFLCTVGTGTMVSDGLSLLNADYSGSSFRLRHTAVAPEAFLGNDIAYPPDARVGRNCLLATKVLVPLDGPVREDVGLLGSPAFEIPRTVRRDREFDHLATGAARRRGLRAKLRHNTGTMGWYLLVQWLNLTGVVGIGALAGRLHPRFGVLATAGGLVGALLFSILFLVLAERAAQGFRRLRPRFCSIYDPVFWRHERFWKLSAGRYLALFDGTALKGLLWRLLGVRIGRRVFDDGCAIPEKSLATVGDDVVLNTGSVLQCHSLEDGTFKSGHVVVGTGATVGVGAFVHYGVTVGEGTVVEADAFLMKGSETPPRSRWRGNPATEVAGEPIVGDIRGSAPGRGLRHPDPPKRGQGRHS